MLAGRLEVEVLANLARFDADLRQMRPVAERGLEQVTAAFDKAGARMRSSLSSAITGAVAALGTGMIVQSIRASIDAVDALNDAADATGSTVERLSAIQAAAVRAGSSLEPVVDGITKLNMQLKESDDPSGGFALALDAIGLSAQQLRQMDPADAILEVARAQSRFADDANKARLNQELFGKAAGAVVPVLKDLADQTQLTAAVTAEQAAQAEAASKSFAVIGAGVQDITRVFAVGLAPIIGATVQHLRDGAEAGDGFANAIGTVRGVAAGVAKALAFMGGGVSVVLTNVKTLAEYGQAALEGRFGDFGAIAARERAALDGIRKSYLDYAAAVDQASDASASAARTAAEVRPSVGDVAALADAAKRRAEAEKAAAAARKRATDDGAKAEAQALESARRSAQAYADTWTRLNGIYANAGTAVGELSQAQQELLRYLESDAYAQHTDQMRAQVVAMAALADEREREIQQLERWQAALDEDRGARWAMDDAQAERTAEAVRAAQAQEDSNRLIGASTAALAAHEAALLRDAAAEAERRARILDHLPEQEQRAQLLREEAAALIRRAAAVEQAVVVREGVDAAKAAMDQAIKDADRLERAISDALLRGFESGKGFGRNLADTLRNTLKSALGEAVIGPLSRSIAATIRAAVGGVGQGLSGTVSSLLGQGGGTAGGSGISLGSIGDIGGLFRQLNSGITSSISDGFAFAAQDIGSFLVNNTSGPLNQLGGSLMSNAGSIGSFASSAAPYIPSVMAALQGDIKSAALQAAGTYIGGSIGGPIGAAIGNFIGSKVSGLIGNDTPPQAGGVYSISAGGTGLRPTDREFFRANAITSSSSGFADFTQRSNEAFDAAAKGMAESIFGTLGSFLREFDQEAQSVVVAFRHNGEKAKANIVIGGDTSRGEFKSSSDDPQKALAEFATYAAQSVITALDKADLPGWVQSIFDQLDTSSGIEALQAAMATVQQIQDATEAINNLDLSRFVTVTEETVFALAQLSGGIGNLQSALSGYYTAFYSEEERAAKQRLALGESLAKLADNSRATFDSAGGGAAEFITRLDEFATAMQGASDTVGVSKEQFRALVEGLDPNEEASRGLYLALLQLAPAVAAVIPEVETLVDETGTLGETIGTAVDAIRQRADLEQRLAIAMGDTAKLAAAARAEIDTANLALYDQVLAAERARDVATERAQLEREILQAQGDTLALRALEREALDESNRALYDRLQAIRDAQGGGGGTTGTGAPAPSDAEAIARQAADLQARLDQALGNSAAIRERERAAIDASNLALYDQVLAAERAQQVAAERADLERQLLELSGDQAAILAQQRAALDESNRPLFDQVQAAREAATIAQQRQALERELLTVLGDSTALRAAERAEIHASNQALYDQIQAARRQAEVAQERSDLEQRLLELTETDAQRLERLRAQLDESNRPIFDQVQAAERARDVAAQRAQLEAELASVINDSAAARAAERAEIDASNLALYDKLQAARDAAAAASERDSLTLELLRLQGDTAALRERERAALHESNRALYDHIKALEDVRDAQQRLDSARSGIAGILSGAESRLEAAQRRLAELTGKTTQTVQDTGNALRDLARDLGAFIGSLRADTVDELTGGSLAAAQAQFAITAAQAQAGDAGAQASLIEQARRVIQLGRDNAETELDFIRLQNSIIATLQGVAGNLDIPIDEIIDQAAGPTPEEIAKAQAEVAAAQAELAKIQQTIGAAGIKLAEVQVSELQRLNELVADYLAAQNALSGAELAKQQAQAAVQAQAAIQAAADAAKALAGSVSSLTTTLQGGGVTASPPTAPPAPPPGPVLPPAPPGPVAPPAPPPGADVALSGDLAELLALTRRVLEQGGASAQALAALLEIERRHDDGAARRVQVIGVDAGVYFPAAAPPAPAPAPEPAPAPAP